MLAGTACLAPRFVARAQHDKRTFAVNIANGGKRSPICGAVFYSWFVFWQSGFQPPAHITCTLLACFEVQYIFWISTNQLDCVHPNKTLKRSLISVTKVPFFFGTLGPGVVALIFF